MEVTVGPLWDLGCLAALRQVALSAQMADLLQMLLPIFPSLEVLEEAEDRV
jgi:hypothetical protein